MSWGDYFRLCVGYQKKEINGLRKLRLILSAQTGEDSRNIIPLPGDWDDLPEQLSQEESVEILNKHGLYDELLRLERERNATSG